MPPQPTHPPLLLEECLRHKGFKFTYVSQRLRFPNGVEGVRECVLHPGGAVAVPLTAAGNYLCIRQYRFAIGRYIYEFPAGTLEPNELPDVTVRRELEEETGYRASQWDDLGCFYLAPGYSDETMYVYLARELERLPQPPAADEDEDIEVVELSPAELMAKACNSVELDAKSIACFLRSQQWLDKFGLSESR